MRQSDVMSCRGVALAAFADGGQGSVGVSTCTPAFSSFASTFVYEPTTSTVSKPAENEASLDAGLVDLESAAAAVTRISDAAARPCACVQVSDSSEVALSCSMSRHGVYLGRSLQLVGNSTQPLRSPAPPQS